METIAAKIKFDIYHWPHEGREITTIDNPLQTLEKAMELIKQGVFIREIVATVEISNCIFKKTFHTLSYFSTQQRFKNFKRAFNLYFC